MPAPKGNNYWEFRNKHGRNHAYEPEQLWDEAVSYFDWMQNRVWNKKEALKSGQMAGELIDIPTQTPMSIKTFCLFADISHDTFQLYEKGEGGYKDFYVIAKQIKHIIESQQFEGATVGAYNPSIIARTLGLADTINNNVKASVSNIDPSKLSDKALQELEDAANESEE